MSSTSSVKNLISQNKDFRIKSERNRIRHHGSLHKVTEICNHPFEGSMSNCVTQTQNFYEINSKQSTEMNFYKTKLQNKNVEREKVYFNQKTMPKTERINNGFPQSKDLKDSEIKILDLLTKFDNQAFSDRENFAKNNRKNLKTSLDILDAQTKKNSLHQQTMVNILEVLNGYLWFYPEDYKKDIEEIPEIMDKVMINFIANNEKKIPQAYVFKALQKTVIPLIKMLNTENAALTKNLEKKAVKEIEMRLEITKFQQLLENLDLKKQIDILKSDRKELRDLNVDIGLRFKHLKAKYDTQESEMDEQKLKAEEESTKLQKIKNSNIELQHSVKELEGTIETKNDQFLTLQNEFRSGKEMIDKMVLNLSKMKDKIISMKEENDFLKEGLDNVRVRNNLGLEAMTPRPQYHALVTQKCLNKVDENIFDCIQQPNVTTSKVTEYLMDKIQELGMTKRYLTETLSNLDDDSNSHIGDSKSAKRGKSKKKGKLKDKLTIDPKRRDSKMSAKSKRSITSGVKDSSPGVDITRGADMPKAKDSLFKIQLTEPDAKDLDAESKFQEIKDVNDIIKSGAELKESLNKVIVDN